MPDRHFYLLRHHILFYIKFLLFCSLAPDEIRILYGKNKGFPQKSMIFVLRLFPLINQYMKSLFYRCNWKKVHVILK